MTTLKIKDAIGNETGDSIEIQDSWLERAKGEQAVKDSVVAFMAGCRAGTASTKTRGMVSGGGAKPFRQKGTGRARQGSSRAPQYRGGGIVFGPQPRDYSKKVNRKVEKLALRRTFTDRLDADEVILVDALPSVCEGESPKTKKMLAFLKGIQAGESVLILDDAVDTTVILASQNLPTVFAMSASSVNPYLMMYFKKVVITKAGLEALGARLV